MKEKMKDLLKRVFTSLETYLSIVGSIVAIIGIKVKVSIRIGWLVSFGLIFIIVAISSIRKIYEMEKEREKLIRNGQELEKKNNELRKNNRELKKKPTKTEKYVEESFRMYAKNFEKEGEKSIYYFDYNENLLEDAIVSLYYNSDNGGKQICSGRVLNVEPHEYITVEIIPNTIMAGREELFNVFQSASSDIVKNVYIKLVVKEEQLRMIASQLWSITDGGLKNE